MHQADPNWEPKQSDQNTRLSQGAIKSRIKYILRVSSNKKQRQSRNQRLAKKKKREKFGTRIPNTIEEALRFDKEAGNT